MQCDERHGMSKPKITHLQYGGKTVIADWIVRQFPKHEIYLEPFCGSCAVLFAKKRSVVEIVNDLDSRIINMYEMIRKHPRKLAALIWATPSSPENWKYGKTSKDKLEDARLLMAQQQLFSGSVTSSTFAVVGSNNGTVTSWSNWFKRILPAATRLKGVQILNEDANKCIRRVYKKPNALIYVDAPYKGHEKEYGYSVDYEEMVELLNEAEAKVVVSEFPESEDMWKGWHRLEKKKIGTAGTKQARKTKTNTELLFMNFKPNRRRGLDE